ncbi:2Fe-2S iron-sulfur cluster-binding protein [uncultured Methylibium sp.]|uniref:2Fe-2S iron-sulfur cluster-binding protein n=1 Tax=uncultured Methylibium sp. TaxID=381093 RepID=UPI0025E5BDCE|nr:2Fe-2S iron-sulfur cluster-binding protein [uncultured Methylibium sp.]
MPDPTDPPGTQSTSRAAGRHRVRVEPGGQEFEASPDEPLLVAARGAGLGLPSSCRNGSCRACRCRLRSGRIAYRIEWPGLLAEEKAEGWILPCVAHAASDLVIEQPVVEGSASR